MNMKAVGMENLPNIFIDKIEITKMQPPNYDVVQVRVSVLMYDDIENPTWRNRISNLKFKCSLVRDGRRLSLNSGDLSLNDIDVSEPNTRVETCDSLSPIGEKKGHLLYGKSFIFSIRKPQNVNVYVATFIDDLNFGISHFDKFYGPMSGERIFSGGRINKESGYFYFPEENKEYAGPVHIRGDLIMEGSTHTDEPHLLLDYIKEENKKISEVPTISVDVGGIRIS